MSISGATALSRGTGIALGTAISYGSGISDISDYLGQVATRSYVVLAQGGIPQMQSRTYHFSRVALSSVQIVIPNWKAGGSGGADSGSGGTATVTASIEYPAGTFTQILFSGATSATIADGDQVVSDAASVSIPSNTKFFVRIHWVGNASQGILLTSEKDLAGGDALVYGTSVPDQTMSGTITDSGTSNCFYPCAIIGYTTQPSIFIVGDSRCIGSGGSVGADVGEIAPSIGPSFGYINSGVGGDDFNHYKTNSAKRRLLATYCSHVIFQLGTNDFYGGGRTAAQVEADMATCYGFFSTKKIFQSTTAPQTTSTDSWVTLANQTVLAGNAARVTVNDYIRTTPAPLVAFFEVTDQVESARNSGKWIVNGTASYATADGIHETQAAYNLITASGCIPVSAFTL